MIVAALLLNSKEQSLDLVLLQANILRVQSYIEATNRVKNLMNRKVTKLSLLEILKRLDLSVTETSEKVGKKIQKNYKVNLDALKDIKTRSLLAYYSNGLV